MEARSLIVRAPRLIDGKRNPVVTDAAVVIEGDRIVFAGSAHAPEVKQREEHAEVREFPGCTLIPGLIDSHVHLCLSAGQYVWEDLASGSDNQTVLRMAMHAGILLDNGITTVRDLGAPNDTIFDLRAAAEKGLVRAPRILGAGPTIVRTGGHTHVWNGVSDGPDEIRKTIRRLAAKGSDVVKMMATGGWSCPGNEAYVPSYTDEELAAGIDEAHRYGRPITVHISGTAGAWQAVRLGVDGLEHLPMVDRPYNWSFDDKLAELICEKGIYVAPTIAAGYRYWEASQVGTTSPPKPGRVGLPTRLKNLKKLYETGIQLIVGTDSGARMTTFDDSVALEMESFVGAGMPALEAIEAATSRNAKAIGRGDEVGSLEAGKMADLVAVKGDPSTNISDVRNTIAVFLGGEQVVSNEARLNA